ncbi:hypothetical protein [Pseudomonas nunensis]|uniref:hypothetical protein n=1 Tax=Pseudomonas nunensis TaxID=2961896 RepID=UPI000A6EDF6A|nr:hypothetical protein [Pseudomonas nunensis]
MSDQPELPEPVNTSDTTGIQGALRPLNAPRQGALVSRNGFIVRGPDFHSVNDETVKLHLYVSSAGTNRFVGERVHWLQPNVVPFTTDWNMPTPAWVTSRASAYFLYQFKLKNGGESDWYDSGWFEVATPPVITSHVSNQAQDVVRPTLRGTGEPGCLVRAVKVFSSSIDYLSQIAIVNDDRTWALPLTRDLPDGAFEFEVRMWLPAAVESSNVSTGFIYNLLAIPVIAPLPDNGFIKVPRLEISGTGVAGAQVDIHKSGDGTTVYGTVSVQENKTWKVTPSRDLPQGAFQLTAKQRKDGKTRTWASAVSAFGLFPLTITGTTAEQDTAFTLSGTGGLANADVVVYLDLTNTLIGNGKVTSNGSWNVAISGLIPGTRSLTVLQKHSSYTSDRSLPRAFKIRPPKLTQVNVEPLPNQAAKLSGAGYDGAMLALTYISGPENKKLPEVPVVNGAWQLTTAAWAPGIYFYSAIQKVSDNAGGWIPSQDLIFTFPILPPELEPVPDPTNVTYTRDYTPTFSGNGVTGATVMVRIPSGAIAAPDTSVVYGRWSSQAIAVWGPVFERLVHLRQALNGQESPSWIEIKVSIPPLAPQITDVVPDGLSPTFTGNCWQSGAVVNLAFSDNPSMVETATVTGGTWTFRRAGSFAPNVTHTVTVTQVAAQQTSPPTTRTFEVSRTLLKPIITYPMREIEVELDLNVTGRQGVAGASLQLRIDGINAGAAKQLDSDGDWSVELKNLAFGRRILDAQQTLDGRPSERSESVPFYVVLMPPLFTTPRPGSDLPRVSTISGEGLPGAKVEVWLDGRDDFLLTGVTVNPAGHWEGPVTLPVGVTKLRARQAIGQVVSNDGPLLTCNVVPVAPYIETPVEGGHIGRSTVVSGFGVPGDTVTILLGENRLGSAAVLEDRTWSVSATLTQPGGAQVLVVVASLDGFESDRSARRPVVLGSYVPIIDSPQAGRWVSDPVAFSGQGRAGIGQLVSWFNPEQSWAPNLSVSAQGWQGLAVRALPAGGNWCRFKQTIVDGSDASTISDWSESGRFEVLGPPSP